MVKVGENKLGYGQDTVLIKKLENRRIKKILTAVHLPRDLLGGKAKNRDGFPSRFGKEMRVENRHKIEVKGKVYKRECNKISRKLPNSTKGFKNEGAELSRNGFLLAPSPPFLGVGS